MEINEMVTAVKAIPRILNTLESIQDELKMLKIENTQLKKAQRPKNLLGTKDIREIFNCSRIKAWQLMDEIGCVSVKGSRKYVTIERLNQYIDENQRLSKSEVKETANKLYFQKVYERN